MAASVADLLAILALDPRGDGVLRGTAPAHARSRVFGGQVLAQALIAAGTVLGQGLRPGSLQATFLLPGDPARPIDYTVNVLLRDTDSCVAHVAAHQSHRHLVDLTARFVPIGTGHASASPRVLVVDPLTFPSLAVRTAETGFDLDPLEWAGVDYRYATKVGGSDVLQVYLRTEDALPADDLVHASVLAYASDLTMIDAMLYLEGLRFGQPGLAVATLNHSIWFHAPVRCDSWLLHHQQVRSESGQRGLVMGEMITAGGGLVATTAQEGLIRLR